MPQSDTPARSAIVIGAGLSGCLSGILLAQRGFTVNIYEYRADARTCAPQSQRSINLAISTRGLTALHLAGLADQVRALGVPMHGRCVHPIRGALQLQRYGGSGEHLLSIPRDALNKLLLDACTSKVRIHFQHKCVQVDLRSKSATFLFNRNTIQAHADLIIGADGTFSRVRAAMMREPPFDYSQAYISASYKEIELEARRADGRIPFEWLHIWPRHRFMLIALPNHDGSFTCTLFLDSAKFAQLRTADDVNTFFATTFPDVSALMPDLPAQFLASPTAPLLTTRCTPYHYRDSALLIGDAAHSMVPFYGQGSQVAFEDCRILAQLLDKHRELGVVLSEYTKVRKPNADAIADLSLDNYIDMASRSVTPLPVLRKRVGVLLHKLFPNSWLPLYTMISFTNIPYAEAVARARRQEKWVVASTMALATAGVAATCMGLMRLLRSHQSK